MSMMTQEQMIRKMTITTMLIIIKLLSSKNIQQYINEIQCHIINSYIANYIGEIHIILLHIEEMNKAT